MYKDSLTKPDEFWGKVGREELSWFAPFTDVSQGCLEKGNYGWYLNGKLNVCYNCVDRHLKSKGNDIAILWEGNRPEEQRTLTYQQLHEDVCKFANALKRAGATKGSRVAIYLPMIPELPIAMLACARIGAIHSVVFAGFSSDALRDRIIDAKCEVVITSDEGLRADKFIPLKKMTDQAVQGLDFVKAVFTFKRTGNPCPFTAPRDIWWHDALAAERSYCPCEVMDSEDALYILYTSGSTGKPKGVLHTSAGYLAFAAITHRYIFDYHPGDVYACMADIGWVTGHTYIVYGPLCNGATSFVFEGTPMFPTADRYWDMIARHKINQFYTAPTAIRSLIRGGSDPTKFNLSSLKVLGSVGEPINPAAWLWYYEKVGRSQTHISDTYWQTETGGIVITPLPGCTPLKPGSATFPFFGCEPVMFSQDAAGKELTANGVEGVLCFRRHWPGLARTLFGAHDRFLQTYMSTYKGCYFTGDGCYRDKEGYYWIIGRADDVVKVSGHRIGSAEVEHALVSHPSVAEAAAIGIPHEVKGQVLFAYVILKQDVNEDEKLIKALVDKVREKVGGLAVPDTIVCTPGLPKTRSGKIMRRILRKIATRETEEMGDISTLADPSIVETLIQLVNKKLGKK
jgi:acetyl-CoA synthetase